MRNSSLVTTKMCTRACDLLFGSGTLDTTTASKLWFVIIASVGSCECFSCAGVVEGRHAVWSNAVWCKCAWRLPPCLTPCLHPLLTLHTDSCHQFQSFIEGHILQHTPVSTTHHPLILLGTRVFSLTTRRALLLRFVVASYPFSAQDYTFPLG